MTEKNMKNFIAHLKSSGFVFPGSEIYGGLANTWDYGPFGAEMKSNLISAWKREFITKDPNMYFFDSKILMNPQVWKASGHVDTFADLLIENKTNGKRYRLDHLIEAFDSKVDIKKMSIKDQFEFAKSNIHTWEDEKCQWSEPKQFNLLFETKQGVVEGEKAIIYLRPETAQGIFVNFKNVQRALRLKVPFGIAQVGKAFRNEITPGNFIFRTREFEQMEIEYFTHPSQTKTIYDKFLDQIFNFVISLGINKNNLRKVKHSKEELSHYSSETHDLEYNFPFGWSELCGLANRTNYDLKTHEMHSKQDMKYLDPQTNEKYWPYVVEPSMGVDRFLLMILWEAFNVEELPDGEERIILKLPDHLAPYKIAILPLVKKLDEKALEIFNKFLDLGIKVLYDNNGSIGKRYRRQDSIGTPYCLTIDYQSLEDNQVTIRSRDSMKQNRLSVEAFLKEFCVKC